MEGKKIEDKTLDQLLSTFVNSLDIDSVVDDCVTADLITMDDLEKIQANVKSGNKRSAIREFISQLKRNAPGYLKKFHDVLKETKMSFLGDEIVAKYTSLRPANVPDIFAKQSVPPPTAATEPNPPRRPLVMPSLDTIEGNSSLVGDGERWPFDRAQPLDDTSSMEVPPPPSEDLTDARGLPEYRMKANPRGVGIIINNKIFTCGMKNREGTDRDAAALQRLFTHLGFFTNRYNDLTGSQVRRIFNDVAAIDHKKFDCLMIAILTHGIKGKLYGTDGELIPVEDLTKLFNGYRCPSLIGKPKIFLLQACRGGNFDYGVEHDMTDGDDTDVDFKKAYEEQFPTVQEKTFKDEADETDSGYTGTVPAEADYLLAYATIPGYVSWRNNENGSWFVSAMVNVFMEMAEKEHLLDMLTEVNRRVAEEFESRSGKNKQVPEPVSRLRKKLYFRPGKYS